MEYDELKQRILVDHAHLDRTFESLEATLEAARGGSSTDYLADATDDLSFALDEMLEHFGIEEEAIFLQIRAEVPALSQRIDALEAAHEVMCSKTSRLRKLVGAAKAGYKPLDLDECLQLTRETKNLLTTHNRQEIEVFFHALDAMRDQARTRLIDDLERL
jgi:iron-sulfur cluster repair protein YtfE (RIC family)